VICGPRVGYIWPVKQLLVLGVLALASTASAERPHGKPSAPVEVRLETAGRSAGGYVVTLVATPTRAVPSIELRLAGKRLAFGATAAGQQRKLAVQVDVAPGAGLDVVGTASVGVTGSVRTKAAVARVGTAKLEAPKRTVIRTLRDGRDVAEVR